MFLGTTRTQLLSMIDLPKNRNNLIADIGCGRGCLTQSLSLKASIVGLDVNKKALLKAKKSCRNADFVCADACNLPLVKGSVDLAVVSSVFEFVEKLDGAIKEVDDVLGPRGTLVTGYPIETRMLKNLIRIIDRNSSIVWNPKGMNTVQRDRSFRTHKHRHQMIRDSLLGRFKLIRKKKWPSKFLPDLASVYECARLTRISV